MTTLTDWIKNIIAALLIAGIFLYTMVSCTISTDPREWRAKIAAEQLAAQQAEWDRICHGQRP